MRNYKANLTIPTSLDARKSRNPKLNRKKKKKKIPNNKVMTLNLKINRNGNEKKKNYMIGICAVMWLLDPSCEFGPLVFVS